ncbi:hypothetical protein TSTA_047430 [Talaromyces stipitatus ATCC 10500]|uniref:Adaptive response protein AidB N-terminal domain-containing protein n=1 Tax=Talaromyces stipitatus (strain ATCC 10500 / CBS 375.48 / QM 6759 / NRRL 1006) TaxID=441959 RepID=B8MKD9_TALSN|nr:uncharacterized protein TSTA_047430 [Talaromyces stipitatus ATCC 10500]EED15294.1 hypothetical protein TSTA_047430 [Talaromyces stipitatus ATCC 10500]
MGVLGTTPIPLRGSSSTEGFFQRPPKLVNQFIEDVAFRRAFEAFLPVDIRTSVEDEFEKFADEVLTPKVFGNIADAERNLSYVKTWDMWGNRVDEVVLSNGWNNLVALVYRAGLAFLLPTTSEKVLTLLGSFRLRMKSLMAGLVVLCNF